MLATPKDAERGGSGILDVKALDILEGYDGESQRHILRDIETTPRVRSAVSYAVASPIRCFR